MLIILPPSETKRPAPETGPILDLRKLSFAELNPLRERLIEALIETSGHLEAFERLRVGPSKVREVLANTELRELPTQPAAELYTGPLHQALAWPTLGPRALGKCQRDVVIASALWGLLRPHDAIPTYRLHLFARLVGVERLDHAWRASVSDVLTDLAAPHPVVLDLRSPEYQALGVPSGLDDRMVTIRVLPAASEPTIGNVLAKRVRGEVARELLESDAEPAGPDDVAEALSERWPVRVDPPARSHRTWTLRIRLSD